MAEGHLEVLEACLEWVRNDNMIKNISVVAFYVSNRRNSAKWFREKLGFKVVDNYGHWLTVAPKSARKGTVTLHLCETKKSKLEPGNTGISFTVDNLDKSYKEMTKKGVKFTKAPRDEGWGKYAMIRDPDGNEFWLFE